MPKSDKIRQILEKKSVEPIVCISAYTYPIANLIDKYCDMILVGDSLGMTIYGMEDTLSVSKEMMINHGKAVTKAAKKSLILVDLPFGTYESSKEQALQTCTEIMQETKCDAVKIEISPKIIPILQFLTKNNIPVAAHVGLTPQYVKEFGGFKIQGRSQESANLIADLALKSQEAGAFCLFIEGVLEHIASKISKDLTIPTIGIGASVDCDGQVLVIDDMVGIKQEYSPKFVKSYADLSSQIEESAKKFASDVKNRKFPEDKHCFFVS